MRRETVVAVGGIRLVMKLSRISEYLVHSNAKDVHCVPGLDMMMNLGYPAIVQLGGSVL